MDYFINNIPVETTINNCTDLREFQKIVKLSGKYKNLSHHGVDLEEKTVRVFASRSKRDGSVEKVKGKVNRYGQLVFKAEKVANTPEKCFLINDNILNMDIPRKLDRNWYIETAKKRINDFKGV